VTQGFRAAAVSYRDHGWPLLAISWIVAGLISLLNVVLIYLTVAG
jgi:Mn2+/Fe2+ NRAMP family transporter